MKEFSFPELMRITIRKLPRRECDDSAEFFDSLAQMWSNGWSPVWCAAKYSGYISALEDRGFISFDEWEKLEGKLEALWLPLQISIRPDKSASQAPIEAKAPHSP